jgi:type II secretory pathway component PulC
VVQGILTALQTILGCACLYTLSASVLDVASMASIASEPLRAASTRGRPPLRGSHEIGHYQVIVERDLFAASALPDAAAEPTPAAPATATRLPLQLRGPTVMSDASRSLAVIEDTRTSETTVVATGDPIGEARVERIERERVLVSHAGRRELIVFPNERRSLGSASPGRDRSPGGARARPRSEARHTADRVRRQRPPRATASSPPPTDDLRDLPPASADPR